MTLFPKTRPLPPQTAQMTLDQLLLSSPDPDHRPRLTLTWPLPQHLNRRVAVIARQPLSAQSFSLTSYSDTPVFAQSNHISTCPLYKPSPGQISLKCSITRSSRP